MYNMEVKIVKDKLLCRGRRIRLYNRVIKVGERTFDTDLVSFGESVVIVPVKSNDEIILLRQYRSSINRWILELPAGRIDEGEDVMEAANRELIEETGYKPLKLNYIGSFYVSPGYSDEYMHLVVAKELKYVGAKPEEDEIIRTTTVEIDKVLDKLYNEIIDGKTIIGILTYLLKRDLEGI